jgi:hypothetical protein
MITSTCQRWRDHRDSYRPVGEPIRTAAYDVAAITDDATAKRFVLAHHWLYHREALVGVAVFSHPCSDRVLTSVFPGEALDAVELGRFVLLDDVPANGESWFLARAFAQLRALGLRGVVSFSDPVVRLNVDGAPVFPGHVGTIYQATNAVYLGRASARTLRLLPDGAVFSARAAQKIRVGERGWQYAAEQLERAGAAPVPTAADARRVWLREQLERVTRTIRHQGNHRYAFAFERNDRQRLAALNQTYPKAAAA